jgi:hypothetical protein
MVLRQSNVNPRYFEDENGKVVFLAGCHTWINFRDYISDSGIMTFDYSEYIGFLRRRNMNYTRLWVWEAPRGPLGRNLIPLWRRSPYAWPRTGPGLANDGLPCFDLERFDEDYFKRLRSRIAEAGESGIYVTVMLFGGVEHFMARIVENGFPFNGGNNINGIVCGGLRSQTLLEPRVLELQERYVRKVIDTINDLDNVLYEISNEAGPHSIEWQYHMIKVIKDYQSTKKKQHPVGMSWVFDTYNDNLWNSDADWIAPGRFDGFGHPPAAAEATGDKVVINDSDHSFYYTRMKTVGHDGQREWIWKNFTRGYNLAFMDPYLVEWPGRNVTYGTTLDSYWDVMRDSLGFACSLAGRVDMAAMLPRADLASTEYCLASLKPGEEAFILYLPTRNGGSLDLSGCRGTFSVELLDTRSGRYLPGEDVAGGETRRFVHPYDKDSVLHVRRKSDAEQRA